MADEIQVNARVQITNSGYTDQWVFPSTRFDQSAVGAHNPIIDVGTSEEVISQGDVSTPGMVIFQNLDSTNYVEIGPESGGSLVPFIRLNAGEFALLWLTPSVTLRAQANTASVKLMMRLMEN